MARWDNGIKNKIRFPIPIISIQGKATIARPFLSEMAPAVKLATTLPTPKIVKKIPGLTVGANF